MKKINSKYHKIFRDLTAESTEKYNILEKRRLMKVNRLLSNFKIISFLYWIIIIILFVLLTFLLNSLSEIDLKSSIISEEIIREQISMLETIKANRLIYYFLIPLSVFLYFRVLYMTKISFGSIDVGQGGGTARWTTREELEEQYKKIPDKDVKFPGHGGPPIARDGNFLYIDDTAVNNLIIGTSRSGKGEEHVFVSIDIYSRAEEQASMIIGDPKLELAPASIPTLQARGYDCYVLNLIDPEFSMGFNPLPVIVQEIKEKEYSTAQQLCRSLCYNIIAPNLEEKDPYWSDQARNVLIASIWADIEDNLAADNEINNRRLYHHMREESRKKDVAIKALSDESAALFLIKEEADRLIDAEPTLTYFGLFSLLQDSSDLPLLAKEVINHMDLDHFPRYIMQEKPKIAYVPTEFISSTENEEKINLYSIVRMVNTLYSTTVDKTHTALDLYFQQRDENDFARQTYSSIGAISSTGNTKGTIMSVFQQKTSLFLYDSIGRMMAKNDLNFIDVGFGQKPIAIFIGLPDFDKSNHFIATIFINQLYFTLAKMATAMPTNRTLRDVAFILDEFGNLPPLDNIESIVSVALGRGLRFHFIVQALSQLEDKYGENTAKTIMGNCGNQKYILTTEDDTAEKISKALGNETYTSVTRTGKKLSLNKDQTESTDTRPLMSVRQLLELEPGETIVLRYLKRQDENGNPVRATPIGNLGQYRMKYRHQYLADSFPSNKLLYRSKNMDRIISNNPELRNKKFDLAGVNMPDTTTIDLRLCSRSGKEYLQKQLLVNMSLCDFSMKDPKAVYELFELINVPEFEREQLLAPDSGAKVADMFAYADMLISSGRSNAKSVGYQMLDILSPINYADLDYDEDLRAAEAFEAADLLDMEV